MEACPANNTTPGKGGFTSERYLGNKKMNKPFELPTVIGAILKAVNMDLDPLGRPLLHHLFCQKFRLLPK